jgi:hypothetical protein
MLFEADVESPAWTYERIADAFTCPVYPKASCDRALVSRGNPKYEMGRGLGESSPLGIAARVSSRKSKTPRSGFVADERGVAVVR